jgi:hypothetical protein
MDYGIKLAIVYADEHLIELRVNASNGLYAGQVDIYLALTEMREMADALKGFPTNNDDNRDIELGEGGPSTMSVARLQFSCADSVGHSRVDVDLRNYSHRGEAPGSVAFGVETNIGEIDQFVRQLEQMKMAVGDSATLMGIR